MSKAPSTQSPINESGIESPRGVNSTEANHSNHEDTKPYVCRYFHNGGWWGLEIHAFDDQDAEERAKKLGNLQVLGRLEMTIPANRATGLFVRGLCAIRNFFYAS